MDASKPLNRKDFTNGREVRWCPGCGDYAILAALQKTLPLLDVPQENHIFVSGIGCSGRLPYYMNTYGFHTLHGRAFPVATALSALNPDWSVWVITGDGDALSIGTNHLIHALRRNVNLNILMLNNQVYGLTKGQFSPTSPKGMITKTSPEGVSTEGINPLMLALSAGASFVARAVDKDPAHLSEVLQAAHRHQGTAFIEIYQDCHIFNPGAFDAFSTKSNRAENVVYLEPGCDIPTLDFLHDPAHFLQAMALTGLSFPDAPVPLGVYYQNQTKPVYELTHQRHKKRADLSALYRSKPTWTV